MPRRLIAELERIRYREGQLLGAHDLQDDKDFEALFRWMHTRFLHNTWGIALGLDVELVDRSKVRVLPGLAYDCHGQELLLVQLIEIDIPMMQADETFDLVIRYKDAAEFPTKPEVVAVCLPDAMDPKQERPIFHPVEEQSVFLWRRPAAVRVGEEIPLARVQSAAAGNITVNRSVRRNARPLVRPHVGYGHALVEVTSMVPWTVAIGERTVQIGIQVEIDTAEAGFTQTPCYVVMTKLLTQLPQTQLSLPVPGFESIADARREKFTYRILTPELEIGGSDTAGMIASLFATPPMARVGTNLPPKISISWLGVESGQKGHATSS